MPKLLGMIDVVKCLVTGSLEYVRRHYLIKLLHKTEETAEELRQLERKCKEVVLTNQWGALTVDAVLFFASMEVLLFTFR